MSFPFLRLAVLASVGWVLYRSTGSQKQDEERADAGAGAPDVSEAGAEQADADATPEATAAPGPAAPEPDAPEPDAPEPDDLTRVVGIGPAIARILSARGIVTWVQLAAADVAALQAILEEAGPRFRFHDPSRWPEQAAELASAN